MLKLILIIIILFIVSGFLRRIIFSSAYNAFNKAAEDFNRKNNQSNKPKEFRRNRKESNDLKNNDSGEYIDYEEIN